MVPLGHAGDGGGSIRIPASMCGLFGLKPSRGRVSLGPDEAERGPGLVMRHVVTRSVRDSAAVLDVLRATCPATRTPRRLRRARTPSEVGADPGKLRIGVRTRSPRATRRRPTPSASPRPTMPRALLESLGHTVEDASPAALDEDDDARDLHAR